MILAASLICSLFFYFIDKKLILISNIIFFTTLYSLFALYRVYAFLNGEIRLDNTIAVVLSLVITACMLFFKERDKAYCRLLQIEQLILPFLLIIFLTSRYCQNTNMYSISVLPQVKILIAITIIVFVCEAMYIIKKYWKSNEIFSKSISYGTLISIMSFNYFKYIGAVIPSDLHHRFEDIIGFSQIFELGRVPFVDYIPVSGLYSVVQGAFLKFFGDGFASFFIISENIFYLFIVITVIVLLKRQIKPEIAFLIALCITPLHYNRVVFILPCMLLLSLPSLITKRSLWLIVWFLTSFFHGLYYPVVGAAVAFAFLPLGIFQLYYIYKYKEFNYKFILFVFICLITLILGAGLLTGTYLHIKAMAEQTLLADGIARFAQILPHYIMPFFSTHSFIKIAFFIIMTFVFSSFIIWLSFVFALKLLTYNENSKPIITSQNIQNACTVISLVIFPLISYSYTFVRLDCVCMFSRSRGILFAFAVVLLVYAFRFLKNDMFKYFIVYTSIFIFLIADTYLGFMLNIPKLYPYYYPPSNCIFLNNNTNGRYGTGFIERSEYINLESVSKNINHSNSYFAFITFGYYYIYNIKGDSTCEHYTVKGYDAVKETVNILLKNNSVVYIPAINSYYFYYLYNWLMTSGNYVFNPKDGFMYPNKNYSLEEVHNINKLYNFVPERLDMAKIPSSLGLSFKSLNKVFSAAKVKFDVVKSSDSFIINFDRTIKGNESDFIYIEFENLENDFKYSMHDNYSGDFYIDKKYLISKYFMKKVYNPDLKLKIEWIDDDGIEHSLLCNMDKGKLLISIGSAARWLLDNHSFIKIYVLKNNKNPATPEIKLIKFLKLREVS